MADETCLSSLLRQNQQVTLTGEAQLDKIECTQNRIIHRP
jgi:hypothetical protein